MKKKLLYAFAFVLTLGLLTACNKPAESVKNVVPDKSGSGSSLTINHELGTTTVPLHPKKVAVFDMGVLDIMDEIGADTQVAVPNDVITSWLSKYKNKTNIGSIKEPDLEGLYNYKPDIIFISGRQKTYYPELSKIAPTVYVQIEPGRYMADLEKSVTDLGKIYGKEGVAARKMDDIKKQIADAKAIAANSNDKALILLTNDGSMSAYGKGSRFGLIHDVLGIREADENIKVSIHGQEVGYEYIAKINPDIIYVVDRTAVVGGTKFANTTLDNALVNGTKAGKSKKIITMDAESWYLTIGGLTSTKKMIDDALAGLKK